ncbi:hypothetical protein [Actinoplanes sp. HUAS TT8]|uniref:hypothetical protein n=1 Tax=Actinoplanes sp. HUAS TT8 TaxID=3447453 RepID=UPI003F52012B
MSDDVRRLFDTVLAGPPPDTVDIDASIRTGRFRRRRRVVLVSAAAVLAVAGITTVAVGPGRHRAPTPAVTQVAPAPDTSGTLVTRADQLVGSWRTIMLDGQDMRDVRDRAGKPLGVTFETAMWGAGDGLNYSSAEFSVSPDGRFQSGQVATTAIGSIDGRGIYPRNGQVVGEATEMRLVPGNPATLLLLVQGKIVAEYEATVPASPR